MSDRVSHPDSGGEKKVQKPSERFVPEGHSYTESPSGYGSGIEQLLESKQGFIVGRLGDRVLRLDTDGHLLTVAPTRSGKGVSCIIPNLLDHPGSAFVIDIRGDTIARTAAARLLMGQQVVVLDPYKVTKGKWGYDSFNPLDVLKPGGPGFEQHVKRISQAILFDPEGRSSKDPIWDNATILALNGALTYIKTCLPPERQNMLELRRLFSLQPERRADIAAEVTRAAAESGRYGTAMDVFVEFLTTGSEKTKIPDNTVVQLMTILDWVSHEEFDELLRESTFSFDRLQSEPTTVYLVLPEEYIKGCEVWVRLLFNAALFQLKEVNSIFGRSSQQLKQRERVLFLLDEFPQFGRLQPVEDGMATVAGRGATLWLFIQNISQLDRLYGEHSARQIIGNSSLIQAFNSNEVHELEYFSRVIGEEMFDVQSVTIGMNNSKGGSKGTSRSVTIGNSESLTVGTNRSATTGESFTVSDGTSHSKTKGTSDSVSKGMSDSFGDSTSSSRGNSRNSGGGDGTNTSHNTGEGGEYGLFDAIGIEFPNWKNKNRGDSLGSSYNRNWSQGISDSISRSKSRSRGRSFSRSRSSSASESFGTTHSESRGSSWSTTEGESKSDTKGTSKSESDGVNEGENWSTGQNISYSVKPEQRKIETPRSLRRTMSGGGQLLVLKGHYAFIAPRLMYFEKDHNSGAYRFPEMAILSGETTVGEIWQSARPALLPPLEPIPAEFSNRIVRIDQSKLAGIISEIQSIEIAVESPHEFSQEQEQKVRDLMERAVDRINAIPQIRKAVIDCPVGPEKTEALMMLTTFLMRFAEQFERTISLPAIENIAVQEGPDLKSVAVPPLDEMLLFKSLWANSDSGHHAIEKNHRNAAIHNASWLLKQYETPFASLVSLLHELIRKHNSWREAYDAAITESFDFVGTIDRQTEEALGEAAWKNIERRRNYARLTNASSEGDIGAGEQGEDV